MNFFENMKLLWENEFVFITTLFWCLLAGAIIFFILAILNNDAILFTGFCFCSLFAFFDYISINGVADDIKRDNLEKQKKIEEQQRKDHISKMCFILDTSAKSDLKKDDLTKETIFDLTNYSDKIYLDLKDLQDDYYKKNQTSDGFSNNKNFSKIYSLGYQNLLKIQEEITERRRYCFKQYCSDLYYKNSQDNIDNRLQKYTKLKCKEN